MPDESCRACGGELVKCTICAECRKVTQRICRLCRIRTREQLHIQCIDIQTVSDYGQSILLEKQRLRRPVLNHKKTGLIIAIVASVLFGSYTIGSGILEIHATTASIPQAQKANTFRNTISNPIVPNGHYDNCLATSDGKTMDVKCPAAYGNVYNLVLQIPQTLESQLHQKIFSLRGLTIIENLNSIFMQYEKKWYSANLAAS